VEVIGRQSGNQVIETIELDPSSASTTNLFANVQHLPAELAVHSQEAPFDISLLATDDTSESDSKQKGTGEIGDTDSTRNLFFSIDPETGLLSEAGKMRMGQGDKGTVGSLSDSGNIGFLVNNGDDTLSAYLRVADGSMRQIVLPKGSTHFTVAQDPEGRFLYLLKPEENLILMQQLATDGSLTTVGEYATGLRPSSLQLVPKLRLLLVGNEEENTVSVFSIGIDGILGFVQVVETGGQGLTSIAVEPQERFVYVAHRNNTISRLSILNGTLSLIEAIKTSAPVLALKIDPTGMVMSAFSSNDVDCSQNVSCKPRWKKAWNKFKGAIISVVVTLVITAVVYYYLGPVTAVAFAKGAHKMCKNYWKKGQFCVGTRGTVKDDPLKKPIGFGHVSQDIISLQQKERGLFWQGRERIYGEVIGEYALV